MSVFEGVSLRETTRKEDWAAAIICIAAGGLCAALFVAGIVLSFVKSSFIFILSAALLSLPSVAFFSCAAVYNALRQGTGKRVMRAVTHSMVFLTAAGILTAYLLFFPVIVSPAVTYILAAFLWLTAAAMIPLSIILFVKTEKIRLALYYIIVLLFTATALYRTFIFDYTAGICLTAIGLLYLLSVILYMLVSKRSKLNIVLFSILLCAAVMSFVPFLWIVGGF